MSHWLILFFCIFYKNVNGGKEEFVYPCNNTIKILFDVSRNVPETNFEKEINFIGNMLFERWTQFNTLSIAYFAETSQVVKVNNKEALEHYVRSSIQLKTVDSNICSALDGIYWFEESAIIIFLSVFDKNLVWGQEVCDTKLNALSEKSHFTIIPLSDNVNIEDVKYFLNEPTIIRWNMTNDAPDNWEERFWSSYRCSMSDFPAPTTTNKLQTTKHLTTIGYKTAPLKQKTISEQVETTSKSSSKQELTTTQLTRSSNADNLGIYLGITIPLFALLVVILSVLLVFIYKICQRQNQEFNNDEWKIRNKNVVVNYENKLGAGSFGQVYIGYLSGKAPTIHIYKKFPQLKQFSNCRVAIKILPPGVGDEEKEEFEKEINFMKSLKYHPHLVCMLGYTTAADNLLLVLEYCKNGSLLECLRTRKSQFVRKNGTGVVVKTKTLIQFMWQISNGLEYLTSLGFIHRDVAARNILLTNNETCKIGDFGLCRMTNNRTYLSRIRRMLPIRWLAIESLKDFEFSVKTDVWAFGVLAYEIFSFGAIPYEDLENSAILRFLELGQRLEKPEHCSDQIYNEIMTPCWKADASDRPTFTEICRQLVDMFET